MKPYRSLPTSRTIVFVAVLALLTCAASAQNYVAPSHPVVGSPNTVTANAPVPRPATQPCTVTLFQNLQALLRFCLIFGREDDLLQHREQDTAGPVGAVLTDVRKQSFFLGVAGSGMHLVFKGRRRIDRKAAGSDEAARQYFAGRKVLRPVDIAGAVLYAIDAPVQVNVSRIEILPITQAVGGIRFAKPAGGAVHGPKGNRNDLR